MVAFPLAIPMLSATDRGMLYNEKLSLTAEPGKKVLGKFGPRFARNSNIAVAAAILRT
jgi:hypothetical protein